MRYPKCARPHVSDSPFVTKLQEVLHAKTIRRCTSISPRYLDVIKSTRLFSCFPFCGLFSAIKSLRLSAYVQYLRYRRQLRANRRRDDASHHPSSFRLRPFPLSFSLSFSPSLRHRSLICIFLLSSHSFFGATHTRGNKVEDDRRSK